METTQYLCEFFFNDGFSSLVRLIAVGLIFYALSPKVFINQVFNNEDINDEN